MEPFWITVFVDLNEDEYPRGTAFWLGVTGSELSPSRGDRDEFATLVPPSGDDHLRLQRLDSGRSGAHPDLHVADLDAAIAHAEAVGATLVARAGHAVLKSPAGYSFCFVRAEGSVPAPAVEWSDGHQSRADQLTIDIPAAGFERECRFWADLTGWPLAASVTRPEFTRLATPPELPVRILLQRIEEGTVGAHIDIATDDRAAEVARLAALGATTLNEGPAWTVLTPPAGPAICITDRHPVTGLLH